VLAHVAPHAPQLSTSFGHEGLQPEPEQTATNASAAIAHHQAFILAIVTDFPQGGSCVNHPRLAA
jgi:hypothetical protein